MDAIRLGDPNLFVQGVADITLRDPNTGNIFGYDKILSDGSVETSQNDNVITAEKEAVVTVIHSGARLTGAFSSQAFSLQQRANAIGSTVEMGGASPVCRHITASSTTLTVPTTGITIARHLAQSEADPYGWCYVREHGAKDYMGINYGIDLATGEVGKVQPFVAEIGKEYDVFFFVYNQSAQKVEIGSSFDSKVGTVEIKYTVYANANNKVSNSTVAGYLYLVVPMAKFTGGAGIAGNQTSNATTDYSWQALADVDNMPSCEGCGAKGSPYGYYLYVPCGGTTQSVEGLAVIGGGVSVKAGGKVQIPVKYVVNGQIVQPTYSAMTYTPASASTATVSTDGVVSGVMTGETDVTISLLKSDGTTVTAVCKVTVTE